MNEGVYLYADIGLHRLPSFALFSVAAISDTKTRGVAPSANRKVAKALPLRYLYLSVGAGARLSRNDRIAENTSRRFRLPTHETNLELWLDE